jgi:predicted glycoside hydrolase/deacetylase ChbG (UPF0249 family)
VGEDGRFWSLPVFLRRLLLRQLRPAEIAAELTAQLRRYREMVGREPSFVKFHHHLQVFSPVCEALIAVLRSAGARPYVRRCRESRATLRYIAGSRVERVLLTRIGRRAAKYFDRAGLPGNSWLVGVGAPARHDHQDYFTRWLPHVPGAVVELVCHPGFLDSHLIDRDRWIDGRPLELSLLADPDFSTAVRAAGFVLTAPGQLTYSQPRRCVHVD